METEKIVYYRYPDGSIAHLHYPGGHYVRHDYIARGQLAAVGWDDDENNWWRKLAAYSYLSDGKVWSQDYGNGVRSAFDHDGRGMIRVVDHYRSNVSPTQDLSWRQYWRDTRDRITAFQKSYNPGSNPMENGRGDRFRYDDEGQLVEAWYNASDPANSGAGNTRYDGFAYDALGNRTQNNYVASRGLSSFIRRDNGLNEYSNWTPSVIYHDDNYPGWGPPGNGVTMAEGWITASYNALNQPVAIWSFTYQGSPNFMWFGYDPLGRCVKRWVGESGDVYSNPAAYFHYDGWNLLQEGNNAWGPARVYVHGSRVDEIVWSQNTFTGEQAYHHYDARAHCTLLTDSFGGILEQYEYDVFGQAYFFDATGNAIGGYDQFNHWQGYSLFGNRFLFTGREWLPDVRLYDYRNRLYQPELGRFMQPDPKHFAAGDYNLYRYCHNDPINKSDPTGLDVIVMMSPMGLFSNGMQGHTATISGNDGDGWHLFEKQGGEGTIGNRHEKFGTLEEFRSSGRGDGYTSAARIKTDAVQDQAMREYGEANYNKPYNVETENCANLSRGIAEHAGMSSETKYVNVLGSHIPVPKAVMSEAAKLGTPAINQIHSDGQLKKDEEARLKAMAPGYRQ